MRISVDVALGAVRRFFAGGGRRGGDLSVCVDGVWCCLSEEAVVAALLDCVGDPVWVSPWRLDLSFVSGGRVFVVPVAAPGALP